MNKLKRLIEKQGLSVTEFSKLTEIPKSTISRLLNNNGKPCKEHREKIVQVFDLPDDFFNETKITPSEAATLMGKSVEFIYQGLQDKVFPFGYAVKVNGNWSYWISPKLFSKYTGIDLKEINS